MGREIYDLVAGTLGIVLGGTSQDILGCEGTLIVHNLLHYQIKLHVLTVVS